MRSDRVVKAPPEEQSVCVRCGFCCDGTLFHHAHLDEGERGHLPPEIEKNAFNTNGNEYFRLPCNYFSDKCTIYDQQRANVCGSYRCQLLFDMAAGTITVAGAHETVRRAAEIRDSLLEEYKQITGKREEIYFRKLLRELGKLQESNTVGPDKLQASGSTDDQGTVQKSGNIVGLGRLQNSGSTDEQEIDLESGNTDEPGRLQNPAAGGASLSEELDMLIARCNILEALLIKHFRPAGDFEKLVMK